MKTEETPDFRSLGLSPELQKALTDEGIERPYPIQSQAIPAVLVEKDLCAASPTGSGKTAAFLLPLLQRITRHPSFKGNYTASLILCPTRELAAQVFGELEKFSRYLKIRCALACGGVSINPQMIALSRGVDVLVATPGRLLDLHRKNSVRLNKTYILVLDEADKMLNLGFSEEIDAILALLPEKRQNLLFSATYPRELEQLIGKVMKDPLRMGLEKMEDNPPAIEDWIVPLDKSRKAAYLIDYLQKHPEEKVLIFCKTQNEANRIQRRLDEMDLECRTIHGKKSQGARQEALGLFRKGRIRILVATDLASRGLDIAELPLVINYNLPHLKEDYIHRIGRTGRAKQSGRAFTLVSAEEHKQLVDQERYLMRHLDRRISPDFPVIEELRPSPKTLKPHKPRKPKKDKKNRK